jgi:hypothetical protein
MSNQTREVPMSVPKRFLFATLQVLAETSGLLGVPTPPEAYAQPGAAARADERLR